VAGVERVTLTGRLTRADDQPASGYVVVRMLVPEQVPDDDGVLITTQPERLLLAEDGTFATLVPVTDDPQAPRWIVVDILLADTPPEQMVFTVDGTADPVDLSEVVPVPVVPDSDQHEIAIPWDMIGRPGGVAPLDLNGRVPLQHLPPGQGGDAPWLKHVQSLPQSVFTVAHGFGREPAAVSLHSLDLSEEYAGYQVAHLDPNTVRISMDVPTACVALIS
jgi:hypothetical protein